MQRKQIDPQDADAVDPAFARTTASPLEEERARLF
jgi:hypothetical protein